MKISEAVPAGRAALGDLPLLQPLTAPSVAPLRDFCRPGVKCLRLLSVGARQRRRLASSEARAQPRRGGRIAAMEDPVL
jgi:hypothetical protein